MKDYIFIDGEKLDSSLPLRTIFYGEGVFETFRYKSKLPFLFDKHMDRMEQGAKLLRIPFPDRDHIKKLVEKAVVDSNIADAYVKICLLSRGETVYFKLPKSSQVLVIVKKYSKPKQSMRLMLSSHQILSSAYVRSIKSINYLDSIIAKREALDTGFDEALFLNEKGEVVECSASNIFWYKDGSLYTPAAECGCLSGTTRNLLLDLANSSNIQYILGKFTMKDIFGSEFVFVTNSLIGCVPVSKIDEELFEVDHNVFTHIKNLVTDKLN